MANLNFTFCPVKLGLAKSESQILLEEMRSIPDHLWYDDEFRGCKILPLYNGGGKLGPTNDHHLGFSWSDAGQYCSQSKTIIQENILSHFDHPGRLSILRTRPGRALNVHLDCLGTEVGTLQPKFRMVLNGEIDKLFFLDEDLNRQYVPGENPVYLIDGSHPHALEASTQEKITLCIGSPWTGGFTRPLDSVLDLSRAMVVSRPKVVLPEWVNPIWTRR